MASENEESLARSLWDRFRNQIYHPLYSQFVVALASGNLIRETFLNHASQEVKFFKSLDNALELADRCAVDVDDKSSIRKLRNSLVRKFVPKSTPTVKCTNFLLATASGEVEGLEDLVKMTSLAEKERVSAYSIGAMLPCMRLYAFICKELRSLPNTSGRSHPYQKWVDSYSSDVFEALTLQTEELLDKLSVYLTSKDISIIQKLYHLSMKNVIDFISSQPMGQKTVVPLLKKEHNPSEHHVMVFTGFDITCSEIDSFYTLSLVLFGGAHRTLSADRANTSMLIFSKCSEEFENCIKKILLYEKVEKFDYERLKNALGPYTDFMKMISVIVIKSGFFEGLNLENIKLVGESLKLQDGCLSFFQSIFRNENTNASIHVLSQCLCDDLIKSAFSSGGLQDVEVYANKFVYEESIATGYIVRKMEGPIDKVDCFDSILRNKSDKSKVIVYIGHTVGDLLCLLKADIGIVFRPSVSIKRIGKQFGVKFVPLFHGLVEKQKEMVEGGNSCDWTGGLSGKLYTVSSWAEISAFFVGS